MEGWENTSEDIYTRDITYFVLLKIQHNLQKNHNENIMLNLHTSNLIFKWSDEEDKQK